MVNSSQPRWWESHCLFGQSFPNTSNPRATYQEVPDYQEISSDEGIMNLETSSLNRACSQRNGLMPDRFYFIDLLLDREAQGAARVRVRAENQRPLWSGGCTRTHCACFLSKWGRGEAALGGTMKAERKDTKGYRCYQTPHVPLISHKVFLCLVF